MSHNAWETTSPTSLHPLTHFSHAIIRYLAAYNDVGEVVSQVLLLARPKYFIYCIRYIIKNSFDHLLRCSIKWQSVFPCRSPLMG